MKRFIEGTDRNQVMLLPESVEDYVGADNPVRIVEAFVEQLDLREMGFEGTESSGDWPACISPGGHAQDLHLRLSEPHPVKPPPRT